MISLPSISHRTRIQLISRNVSSVCVAFCVAAGIITFLSLLSAYADNRVVATSILFDLKSGALSFPPVFERDMKTGIDTWDDCVVVEIATYGEKDFEAALSRAHFLLRPSDSEVYHFIEHPCIDLNEKIAPLPIRSPADVHDYWRYWWGSAAFLNIIVGILGLSLPTYQTALKLTTYCVIFSVTSLAFIRYRRAAFLFFPVAFALIFGFAIPLFGQSIAHAPGLIVGFTLLSLYMVAGVDRAPLRSQLIYLFVAGGIGFYFDLFNGDIIAVLICFALIRLVSVFYFGPPRISWPAAATAYPTTGAIVHLIAAFVMGAVSMLVFRIVLRVILTRQNLLSVLTEWQTSLARWRSDKLLEGDFPNIRSFWLHQMYSSIDVATFPYIGKYITAIICAVGGIVYLYTIIWAFLNRIRLATIEKDQLSAALIIAVIVPLEYCVFAAHDMVHFWMMGRLLSLFFALAVSIVFLAQRKPILSCPRHDRRARA